MEKYITPELEVIEFDVEDVIATSDGEGETPNPDGPIVDIDPYMAP